MTQPTLIDCPSCGGDVPVSTKAARVANCPYCESTLIVNEEAIRNLGKMALLADLPSCLAVGYRARCLGREIEVLGRIQYRYHSGLWDEWWVQFIDDESFAWISQDEDEYMLERPLSKLQAPDYDSINPGDKFKIAGHQLWVEERDEAIMAGMQGELPLDAAPDARMRYVDLTDNKIKLTIEYFDDGSYQAFQGRYLKRSDLEAIPGEGPDEDGWDSPYSPPKLEAPPAPIPPIRSGKPPVKSDVPPVVQTGAGIRPQGVNCPSCGGNVQLRDKQGTAMVTCEFCDAVLDVTIPGTAQLLYRSEQQKLPFPIAIGATGKLVGTEWTVIGRVRYREDDPTGVWVWNELQLFNPQRGYAFLALEDGHWMFFEKLEHRVNIDPRFAAMKQSFYMFGQRYKVFERSRAYIDYVEGELSWVARLGDTIGYMDAVRPPQMISAEWTQNEMEWTMGRYLPPEEVAAGFQLDKVPECRGVAPAQPFKRTGDQALRAWAGVGIVLLLLFMCMVTLVTGGGSKVMEARNISSAQYLSEEGYISQPFEIPKGNHVCKLRTEGNGLDNSWVAMSVAFLDEQENVVLDADSAVEYYHGVEGGESWSEGSRSDSTLMRLTGPNTYRLNVFGESGVWSQYGGDQSGNQGATVDVELYRGVVPMRYFFFAAILAMIYPLWEFGRQWIFESSRWPSDDDDE